MPPAAASDELNVRTLSYAACKLARRFAAAWVASLCMVAAWSPVSAQEQLTNGSFELPVTTGNGNHIGVTVPGWTSAYSTNIVRPFVGYLPGGPETTPPGGGSQYFDSDSRGAVSVLRQTFTLAQPGLVDVSAWFSVRDTPQAQTGSVTIKSGTTVLGTATINFLASDALGQWRQAFVPKVPLAAGTYTYEVALDDALNIDIASVFYYQPVSVTKTASIFSDPINGTTNPKAIPGAFVNYQVVVASASNYNADSGSLVITDATPANLSLFVGDLGGAGSGPVSFINGSPASGANYTYTSLASTTDRLDFSNNGGSSWTYVPTPDANGVDVSVTNVRVRLAGAMGTSRSFTLGLRYRVK